MSSQEPLEPQTQVPIPLREIGPALQRALIPARGAMRTAAVRSMPMLVYQMNRIGRSGLAGTGLLLFAAVFVFAAVLPQYRDIAALRVEIREAQRAGGSGPSPHARLGHFLDNLPKRSELPAIAGQVFKLAAAAGITLERGRYELVPMHSGHLARYRMSFPVKGPYPSIRQFIDATLTEVPAAAVDGLRIERKSAGDATVEADLRFSIFVRNES